MAQDAIPHPVMEKGDGQGADIDQQAGQEENSDQQAENRVTLCDKDPLPTAVSKRILRVEGVLHLITENWYVSHCLRCKLNSAHLCIPLLTEASIFLQLRWPASFLSTLE